MSPALAIHIGAAYPRLQPVVASMLEGDLAAAAALYDHAIEEGLTVIPFEKGQNYLIETPVWYYTGRVVACDFGHVQLAEAAQIHWMGDFPTALATGKLSSQDEVSPLPTGAIVYIPQCNITAAFPWAGPLPRERTHGAAP